MPFAELLHGSLMVDAAAFGYFLAGLAGGVREKKHVHEGIKVRCTDENGVSTSLAGDYERAMRFVNPRKAGGEVAAVFRKRHYVIG